MKKYPAIFFLLYMLLFQAAPLFAASENSVEPEPEPPSAPLQQILPPTIDADKEKLRQDARELSRNFRQLFTNLSSLSMKLAKSVVDYIAEWIEINYEKLTEEKQEKLRQFLKKMQNEYSSMKDMSAQTMQKFLEDFRDLLEQLETPDDPLPAGNGPENMERI